MLVSYNRVFEILHNEYGIMFFMKLGHFEYVFTVVSENAKSNILLRRLFVIVAHVMN